MTRDELIQRLAYAMAYSPQTFITRMRVDLEFPTTADEWEAKLRAILDAKPAKKRKFTKG